jgi:hypothetical protein
MAAEMRKLLSTLAALVLSAPVHAHAQDIAPPVQRKPAGAPAPAAPASADEQRANPIMDVQDYQAALTSVVVESSRDAALDGGLVRVMSSLAGVGRCGDAAGLARREGRQELATRLQELCN